MTPLRRDHIIAMTMIVTSGCVSTISSLPIPSHFLTSPSLHQPDWEALADYLGFSSIKALEDHWAKMKEDFIASSNLTTELGSDSMEELEAAEM